jgi:hypothetical protein
MKEFIKHTITSDDIGIQCLLPISDTANKWINKKADGEVFEIETKELRNYQQLKMAWAICRMIADNKKKPEYSQLDTVRAAMEAIKLKLRYIDYYFSIPDKRGNQVLHFKTKSISYAKMSTEEWNEFFPKFLEKAEEISTNSKQEIMENYHHYDGEVENDK